MPKHQAHRGRTLELAIGKYFAHYRQLGIHCHQNHALKRPDGRVVEGEPFDFEAFYEGKLYAFDAKETRQNRWPIQNNSTLIQAGVLSQIQSHGGEAFFLVLFVKTSQIIRYDADLVALAFVGKKASLLPEEGREVSLDVLGVL